MDIMIFPSISEGLGIAVIEAQVAGIHVLASDGVPEDACISSYIDRMSLNEPVEQWAERAIAMSEDKSPIEYYNLEAWDIEAITNKLLNLYENPPAK